MSDLKLPNAKITETRTQAFYVTIEPNHLRMIADAIEKKPGVTTEEGFIFIDSDDLQQNVSIRFIAPVPEND